MIKKMSLQTKSLIKTIIIVFILLSALIFSLTTFGWYSESVNVIANNIQLGVEPTSKIEINKALILKRTGSGQAVDVTNQNNLSLGEYDSTMDNRGIKNPIIIYVELIIPKVDSNYIGFKSNLYCRNTDNWKVLKDGNLYLNNFLSNLIQVKCNYCDASLNELIKNTSVEISYQKASLLFDENIEYYIFNSLSMSYEKVLEPNPSNINSYYIKIENQSENVNYNAIYEGAIDYLKDEEKQNFISYFSSPEISLEEKKYFISNEFDVKDFGSLIDSEGKLNFVFEIDYDPEIMAIFTTLWPNSGRGDEGSLNILGDISHLIFRDGDSNA